MDSVKINKIVMSHLSDAQACMKSDSHKANCHINFAKFLSMNYSNTDLVDSDEVYAEFVRRFPNFKIIGVDSKLEASEGSWRAIIKDSGAHLIEDEFGLAIAAFSTQFSPQTSISNTRVAAASKELYEALDIAYAAIVFPSKKIVSDSDVRVKLIESALKKAIYG